MSNSPLTINEPPVEKRVVDKRLQDGHHAVLVLPQHPHHVVTGLTEVALNARDLIKCRDGMIKAIQLP